MAKKRLDWFKLDCQQDTKIDLIESEFGLTGFAVVIKLWQLIYGGEGYYCTWNEDVALVFAKKNGVGAGVVSEIIASCLRRGIFDKQLYDRYGILTSHGIQERYYDCTDRRKNVKIKDEYRLLCNAPESKNADISNENVYISTEKDHISATEEKREEERRKDEMRAEESGAHAIPKTYQEMVSRYGKSLTEQYLDKVKAYEISTGKHYKNKYAAASKWLDEDMASGKVKKPQSFDIDEVEEFFKSYKPHLSDKKGVSEIVEEGEENES